MPGAYLPAMKYSALHNNPLLRRGRPLPTPLPCREQIVTVMERLCGIGVKRNRRTDHQSCDRKSGTNVMWLNVIKAQRIQQWDVGGPRGKGLGVTGALPYLIARFVLLCVSFPSLPPPFFSVRNHFIRRLSALYWKAFEGRSERNTAPGFALLCLTRYTLTSVWIFSILFFIHFLRCWQGEFVCQSKGSFLGDHFHYFHDHNVWFRADILGRN